MAYKAPFVGTRGTVRSAQPQGPVGIDWANPVSRGVAAVFNAAAPAQTIGKSFTLGVAGSSVSKSGVGLKGGYYSRPKYQIDSAGAGNSLAACRTEHFVFDYVASVATDGVASRGNSATDSSAGFILQNNSGAIRVYDGASYRACGSGVLGARHIVSIVYNDTTPAVTKYYLDGVLQTTVTAYVYQTVGTTLYLGSGYSSAATGSRLLMYVGKSGVIESDADIAAFASNPWQIFLPAKPQIPVAPSVAPRAPVSMRQSQILGMSGAPLAKSGIVTMPRVTRYTQPQSGPAQIDWSNPITRGLVQGFVGNQKFSLTSQFPLVANITTQAVKSFGIGATVAGPSGYASEKTVCNSSAWTYVAYGVVNSAGVHAILTAVEPTPGGSTWDRSLFVSTTTGVNGYTYDGVSKSCNSTLSPTVGVPFLATVVSSGTAATAYFNAAAGTPVATSNSGYTGYTAPLLVFGYGGGSVNGGSATLSSDSCWAYALKFNRALSPAEIASLSANPWQIFAPTQQPIWGNV